MTLQIRGVRDAGDLSKERLVLSATNDLITSNYIALRAESIGDAFRSVARKTFWFPRHDVKQNDLIVLYTKRGENRSRDNSSGNKTFFFYWEQDDCQWSLQNDAVVIAEISKYYVHPISDDEE